MAILERESLGNPSRLPADDHERFGLAYRGAGAGTNWLLVGLVGAGIGILAWHYLAPDLRRYLKIRSM